MQNDANSWKDFPEIMQCLALLLTGNIEVFTFKVNVLVLEKRFYSSQSPGTLQQ